MKMESEITAFDKSLFREHRGQTIAGYRAMSARDRIRWFRIQQQAEGYLELGMPRQALDALDRLGATLDCNSQALYLRAVALQSMERHAEALVPLKRAAKIAPGNIHIWLALGWCFKRTGHIGLAVESLQRAASIEPHEALVQYNLACYLSLAGQRARCLRHLATALSIDPSYRDLIEEESDFDPVRSDPEFQALTGMMA